MSPVRAVLPVFLVVARGAVASPAVPPERSLVPSAGDLLVEAFRFSSGETLPVRLHYRTLGNARRDLHGDVTNAVLLLHGTGGSGEGFLGPAWEADLFSPGQPLDARRYFIVLPDALGHGQSSKPSDGLGTRFPRYDYDDMVAGQRLVLDRLGVRRLRVIVGTSMGCMHGWLWVERHPADVDAFLALSCQPTPIAGRNAVWREVLRSAIRDDPAWNGGRYERQPPSLRLAGSLVLLMTGSAKEMQAKGPTRETALARFEADLDRYLAGRDANDVLYQWDSSRSYDPSAGLESVRARLVAVNAADDAIDPPELGVVEREVRRVPNGRFVLLPASEENRGHRIYLNPLAWRSYLEELLRAGDGRPGP